MTPSEPLLSSLAVAGGLVAMIVDGRRAVGIAVAAAALALAPSANSVGGGSALLVLVGTAAVAPAAEAVFRRLAALARRTAGLDPSIPVFAGGRELFGPRSVRIIAASLALPAASWVSFNAPVGAVALVQGLLLPAAYIWICGALRLVVARHLADVVIGFSLAAVGGGVAWLIRGGGDALPGLLVACSAVVAGAAVAGWLTGRAGRTRVEPQAV